MERILVIEDSVVSQAQLKDILATHYQLYFADNGQEGLVQACSINPRLILLDIRLPGMDGYQVCRKLKSEQETREVPVIFITSMDSPNEKIEGFAAGAEDYIVKPFQPEELLARIKVHLDLRSAKEQKVELERLKLFREMAVGISHEVNNPLTTILGTLHLLERDLDLAKPGKLHEHLSVIRSELDRIGSITKRLASATTFATTTYTGETRMVDLEAIESASKKRY